MATTAKSEMFRIRQRKRLPHTNSTHFLDETLAVLSRSGIPEKRDKLSDFLQVIVLVPKSAVIYKTAQKIPGRNKSAAALAYASDPDLSKFTAGARIASSIDSDSFKFGQVEGCFSAMEVHRDGRPVVLTCKEFKTLAYFIKNPRRVISRNEFLDKVWGYQNYPCTRTVDNHILSLRRKLETAPAHPRHFHTVHGSGYKFSP